MRRTLALTLAAACAAATWPATPVRADDAPGAGAERPWAEGVSPEEQERALALFREGNALFAQSEYAAAARRYREALGHWDHPAIRGNLAVALINLDEPLEAYAQLEAALRYGGAPFEANLYQQLTTHHKLLLGRIAHLDIDCRAAGAQVALDGASVLACPGHLDEVVLVGPHQIVARKRGHLTFTRDLDALPGATTRIEIVLAPLESLVTEERRWPAWRPWTVVGAGALVAAVGLGLELDARSQMNEFEGEIGRLCTSGCSEDDLPSAVWEQRDRAEAESRIGVGALVVGGAAVLAGVALVWMDQPRRVRVDESGKRLAATPLFTPGGAGLALSGRF